MKLRDLLFQSPDRLRQVEALRPSLYRLAYAWCHNAMLADDLTQDAMTRALERGDQLRDPARLKGWLFAILANCWRDHLRGLRPEDDIDEVSEEVLVSPHSPQDEHERRDMAGRVRRAVERLPLGQRQVLTLVDLEECSYAEVGGILGIPIGTVMSRLCRARQALREHLLRAEAPARIRSVK